MGEIVASDFFKDLEIMKRQLELEKMRVVVRETENTKSWVLTSEPEAPKKIPTQRPKSKKKCTRKKTVKAVKQVRSIV